MPMGSGRITIVSDFRPKDLLDIAEEIAGDSKCGFRELRSENRDGFHIFDAAAQPYFYTLGSLIASSAGVLRAPLDIEIYADETKKGEGRLTLDWIETARVGRPPFCLNFVESLADEIETRIEDDGGEVLSSDSE